MQIASFRSFIAHSAATNPIIAKYVLSRHEPS